MNLSVSPLGLCAFGSPRRSALIVSALLLALAVTLTPALPTAAQTDPNVERGFSAEKVYNFGDVDQVNLFNGNLMLNLPVGDTYPVNGNLSYGLTLTYNSNVWDLEGVGRSVNGETAYFTAARPNKDSNAGLGWTLSLGKLYVDLGNTSPRYVGQDGAEHHFYTTLHTGNTNEPVVANVWYTRDGSYLRLRRSSDLVWEVDFGDGTVKRFTRLSTSDPFKLGSVRDAFGNTLSVSYTTNKWTLADGHRTHYVNFTTRANGTVAVSTVDLAAFGGARAVYTFGYTDTTISRSCQDDDPESLGGTPSTADVSLLSTLTLPDASKYTFNAYNTTCFEGTTSVAGLPGTLKKMTLPTLGQVEWAYQTYSFPVRSGGTAKTGPGISISSTTGVATKRILNASGSCETWDGVGCQWTYLPSGAAGSNRATTVTYPTGDQTVFHFNQSVSLDLATGNGWQYGMPIHPTTTDGGGRYLSQEIYDGTAASGTKKRSLYLRFEHDKLPSTNTTPALWYNTNRRAASEKTVFHDDGGKYAEVTRSGFDGLGHYRTEATSGNFGAGDVRSSFVHYNLERGTYAHAGGTGTTFTAWPSDWNWVLGTYSESSDTENLVTAKTTYCFANQGTASMNGVMLRKRVMKGASPGANDLVSRYFVDASGNLTEEHSYGGDVQSLATTADLCTLALPSDQYFVRHTYQGGTRETSWWQTSGGVGLGGAKPLDLVIDVASGLPSASRDSAGVQTNLTYDTMGRLTWEKPTTTNGAWTEYKYTRATSSSALANVLISQYPNGATTGALAQARVYFQPFGRPWRDQKLGADGTWSTVDTVWNAMGWKRSVTERQTGSPTKWTIFKDFDPFGRPQTIQPPDGTGHNVTLTYAGTRQVSRTVKVKSAANEEPATTTERYDRQGRLWQVVEPSGTGATNVTTTYQYDVGGRLKSVSGAGQNRAFEYDHRGFLNWEQHPEKGPSGNGYVRYLSYDALGNPGRKLDAVAVKTDLAGAAVDLAFTYDRAARLTRVAEGAGTYRTLKSLTYATASSGSNRRGGKVEVADRYNYIQIGSTNYTVQVRETYTYAGTGGLASTRATQLYVNGGAQEAFTQSWAYNDLGSVTTLTYPRCTHGGCNGTAATSRTVTFGYTRGWTTSVPGFANSISYHPNGMVNQVAHYNGVTYTQALDPNAMRRPASYSTIGGATNWTSGTYAYDGAGNVTAIGGNSYLYDPVSRLVSASQYTGTTAGTGSIKTQAATYDALGNLTQLTTNGSGLALGTSTATNRLTAATFDSAGSMTSWNLNTYAYEPAGMTRRVLASGIEYDHIYTADDERIWTFQPGAPSRFTLRDLDGAVLREFKLSGATWTVEKDYVYRDSTLLAAVQSTGEVYHLHPDHLGSPRLITKNGGAFVAYHVYHPYGAEATAFNQDTERLKFTGHERDLGQTTSVADDLDYHHARFFNPQIGRYMATDPIDSSFRASPQSFNLYTYSKSNPLRYVDSDGRESSAAIALDNDIGDLLDGTITVATYNQRIQARGLGALTGASVFVPGPEDLVIGAALAKTFRLAPIARGNAIEAILAKAFGGGLPRAFPVIDRFKDGVATSVKSLDLSAATYQNGANLTSRLKGYVDSLARFQGASRGQTTIEARQITKRVLEVVIKKGTMTDTQTKAVHQAINYARANGVEVKIIHAGRS